MNKDNKTKYVILSIVFYVVAGLLAIYAIWSYTYCADIISQARAVGQLASSGNEYDIVSFYMSNCGQHVVFALLLVAAGILLQRKQPLQEASETASHSSEDETDEVEPDEWFDE